MVSDATAVWGPDDLVKHGVTGLVYQSGDPRALARQLRRLLDDRQFLCSCVANGARAAAAYGPDAFARTMVSAVRSVYPTEELTLSRGSEPRQGHGDK